MESSQNHFKIFFKLLIFFFLVLLTLQNCTELHGPVLTPLKVSLSVAFLLSGHAVGVTHNPESGIIMWEHCKLSSHFLYVLCMYVLLLLLPRGSDGTSGVGGRDRSKGGEAL